MFKLTFSTSDSQPLVCDQHADADILDTFLELADVTDTDETGDCLVCYEPAFRDHYEQAAQGE